MSEICNWNDGESTVLDNLVKNPTYEVGTTETIKGFDSRQEAKAFATNNFPEMNLEKLIKEHYND